MPHNNKGTLLVFVMLVAKMIEEGKVISFMDWNNL